MTFSASRQLAHKYCSECRRDFDDLSKVIQKVLASRRELLRYDRQARAGAAAASAPPALCQVSEEPLCQVSEAPPARY